MAENKRKRLQQSLFYLSIFLMLVMSGSIMLMPIASDRADMGNRLLIVITGLLFWIPLLSSYALLIYINNCRRLKKVDNNNKKKKRHLPGIIKVFSNPLAMLADISVLIGILGFVICLILKQEYLTYVSLSVIIFSFQMHCVLNGSNYLYINSL